MKHKLKHKSSILAAYSEAIQSGLPRRLRLLATATLYSVTALWVFPAKADDKSCDKKYTYDYNYEHSDIAFEGSVVKRYLYHPKKNSPLDQSGTYLAKEWIVQENWRGAVVGQTIQTYDAKPLETEDISQITRYLNNPAAFKPKKKYEVFLNINKHNEEGMYLVGDCDADIYHFTRPVSGRPVEGKLLVTVH